MPGDCLTMLHGAITLVSSKSVLRIEFVKICHYPISRYFCNDRCRCNRLAERIAFRKRLRRYGNGGKLRAVDKHVIWGWEELFYGVLHRQQRSLQDIHFVDNRIADTTDHNRG